MGCYSRQVIAWWEEEEDLLRGHDPDIYGYWHEPNRYKLFDKIRNQEDHAMEYKWAQKTCKDSQEATILDLGSDINPCIIVSQTIIIIQVSSQFKAFTTSRGTN